MKPGSKKLLVEVCSCSSLPHVLLMNGLFPSAPMHARTAFSVELLDLLLAITERSSDAVTALAKALNNTYRARGFRAVDDKVSAQAFLKQCRTRVNQGIQGYPMKDPYRKTLGHAMRWYDCLHVELDRRKEAAIAQKFKFTDPGGSATTISRDTTTHGLPPIPNTISEGLSTDTSLPLPTAPGTASGRATEKPKRQTVEIEEVEDEDVAASRRRHEVNLYLLNKCPACFGLREWGRSFAE